MKSNFLKRLEMTLGVLFLLANLSCATASHEKSEESKVDEKISQQHPSAEPGEMAIQGALTFSDMPGITEQQKLDLLKLNKETADEAHSLGMQIRQAKMTLFQTLSTPNYKKSEVAILKKKIVKLDKKRLDVMFHTLDKVEKIIGKSDVNKEKLYEHIFLHQEQNR